MIIIKSHDKRWSYQAPDAYRRDCLPSHQQQAALLERLRVKWGHYGSDAFRCMQVLGDVIAGPDRPTRYGSRWS